MALESRKGMSKITTETSVVYPEGYTDEDIILCNYTITGYNNSADIEWPFCKANKDQSIQSAIRKVGLINKSIKKIIITPIKKIGARNP